MRSMRPDGRSRWRLACIAAHPSQRTGLNRDPWQIDANAEIDARIALQRHQRRKVHRRIGLRIDSDNNLTTAPQQLVNAEVLDVTAVGQINGFAVLIKAAGDLRPKIKLCRVTLRLT